MLVRTARLTDNAANLPARSLRPIVSETSISIADCLAQTLSRLGPLSSRFAIAWIDSCASTNSVLMEHLPGNDGKIHVLVTDRQTAGRGRRGRRWQSWPGGSLTFSLLWRFACGTPAPAGLSLAAGLAVARTLEQAGVPGVQLKWPNDVLVNGEKLVGILVELQPARDRSLAAVIGIGINVSLPSDARIEHHAGVTDLARALESAPPSRPALLARMLAELEQLLGLYAVAGFAALKTAWEQRNAFADLPVRVSGEQASIEGICRGVDDDGALLLDTANGVQRILAGDVSLRPLGGEAA